RNGIEANVTKTYIKKDKEFIPIGDGCVDLFGNYKTMNYIIQAKYRTKPDDKEAYVSPKDIREFAAVLMQQPNGTVGFFVSNAKFSNRAENTATNSKLNLILCNEENIVEKIKEAQLKLENSLNEEIVIEDITTNENTNTDIYGVKINGCIRIEELKDNYYKIKQELTEEKWFMDLVDQKAKNKLKQKYPDIVFEDNKINTSIKRQKERNREGETYSEEYMRKVYREYERIINKMYPKHIVFDTEEDVYLKDKDRYVLDKDEDIDSKLFFIYDATDSKDPKHGYVMKLHAVRNVAPIYYNIKETKVKVFEKNVEEKMAKYAFAGLNINNRNIKFNPNETMDYIVNLEEFDNIKEEVEDTITSSAYIITSFNSDEELKKHKESDNFKYIINRETMRQYRNWIKLELDELEQSKLKRTCRLFNQVCSSYDINEVKHGFYEFVNDWKVLIYRFKLTEDKKYVWIKNGDRMEKRELFRNKEVNYCCGGVNRTVFHYRCGGGNQSAILNICELAKVEELHMNYCNYCTDFNYYCCISKPSYGLGFYFPCDLCEKKEIHLHKICKKCYDSKHSRKLGFVKETIFVE
ncbi:2712_t:CDS:2, partial [Scutellospora calospora]